jgi:pyridoxine 5'-phosphate synthase PdxJ
VNIGHSVIADAVFMGLGEAVRELRHVIERHTVSRVAPRGDID